MPTNEPEDLVTVSRDIIRFTEEALVAMRDACAAIIAGAQPVNVAQMQRLVAMCEVMIVNARLRRAQYDEWLTRHAHDVAMTAPAPPHVM